MILLLGSISGVPWVLIGSSLSLWLKEDGLSRSTIGWAGLIFSVYAFNYLWAPLVDRIHIPYLSKKIGQLIEKIVFHRQLKSYYTDDFTIYNEREIIGKSGQSIIPDRLAVEANKNVTIIDYKTGSPLLSHKVQLENYAVVLRDVGFSVDKKILVYINDLITVEEF